ncbi:MAG: type III polyketide synthase [Chitinivibrionales bacterium]|nr:type III polyketide synthase [Chitinivibrionales bacterium]
MTQVNDFSGTRPKLAAVGTALPPVAVSQKQADKLMARYYKDELTPRSLDVLHKVLSHPSIETRYASAADSLELLTFKNEDPDERIRRFTDWSVRLSREAIERALARCCLDRRDIDAVYVNTCTGYICPGISTYLIEALDLPEDTFAYDFVGSGCGGAVPNLQASQKFVAGTPGGIAVSVSVEICSATFEMGNDIALIISNALFGDGAAAAVVWDRPAGIELIDTISRFLPEYREDVRFTHKNGRLHNRLSPRLPKLLADVVPRLIDDLVKRNNLAVGDIAHWAIHPGGDKILGILQERLNLSDVDMQISRQILREHGNMSSPTVLFEMERILGNGVAAGEWGILVAFGAGLSAYAWLFRG